MARKALQGQILVPQAFLWPSALPFGAIAVAAITIGMKGGLARAPSSPPSPLPCQQRAELDTGTGPSPSPGPGPSPVPPGSPHWKGQVTVPASRQQWGVLQAVAREGWTMYRQAGRGALEYIQSENLRVLAAERCRTLAGGCRASDTPLESVSGQDWHSGAPGTAQKSLRLQL